MDVVLHDWEKFWDEYTEGGKKLVGVPDNFEERFRIAYKEIYNDLVMNYQHNQFQMQKKYLSPKIKEGYDAYVKCLETQDFSKIKTKDEKNFFCYLFLSYYERDQEFITQMKEDYEFFYDLDLHKRYKMHYYLGLVLWMTATFWVPFLIGVLAALSKARYGNVGAYILANGIGFICIAAFISPVTLPLSFFMGAYGWPALLKDFMFSKKHPYNPKMLEFISHSQAQENLNSAAIMFGYHAGKKRKR